LSLPPLTLFTRFSKGEEGSFAIALDSHITESAVILGNSYNRIYDMTCLSTTSGVPSNLLIPLGFYSANCPKPVKQPEKKSNEINDLYPNLTYPRKCGIILFETEIPPLLGDTYMADKINLVVDYEDQVDWLQDSIVIENVELGQNHYDLIIELEQAVFDNTRDRYNPPSSHIQIMGYSPADSDVVVKKGVNYWHSDENIFA
jgi:hypothetical protein